MDLFGKSRLRGGLSGYVQPQLNTVSSKNRLDLLAQQDALASSSTISSTSTVRGPVHTPPGSTDTLHLRSSTATNSAAIPSPSWSAPNLLLEKHLVNGRLDYSTTAAPPSSLQRSQTSYDPNHTSMESGYFYYVENKRTSQNRADVNRSGTSFSTEGSSSSSHAYRKGSNMSVHKEPPIFIQKYGRRYAGDESSPYPLPCDHDELNRQNVRHMIYHELFGAHHAAEFLRPEDIPSRVLDVGCGSGLWSASVADEFAEMGRPDVEFTGLDIVPVHPDLPGVNFRFVKHSLQTIPLPFDSGYFDYIFAREVSLVIPMSTKTDDLIGEYLRVLKPGGILEVVCCDQTIRSLTPSGTVPSPFSGAYATSPLTPFAKPENKFIKKWNKYITDFLCSKHLPIVPCTMVGPALLMEAHALSNIQHTRLALPLDDPKWEGTYCIRGSIAHTTVPRPHSPSTPPMSLKSQSPRSRSSSPSTPSPCATPLQTPPTSILTEDAKALRFLARQNFADLVRNLEPVLREANHISQEDWDSWYRDMMLNFFTQGGLKSGECLEFGAWWARKT